MPQSSAKACQGLTREPIAIIGIGCRFPGANGPQAFWRLLREGVEAITDLPADRFDVDSVYDPEPGTPGKIVSRAGGFLEEIDRFDASFFGISPREASRLDPQQRLLLEVTWEALEDAGIKPRQLAGSKTGVFIGACTVDYEDIQYHLRDRSEIDLYVATGTARSILSGRLSYFFDLQGPSLTVDTACSSSLVAVHLACQSLWNGESALAIAGGVNLVLLPELSMPFSRAKMLAPDSRCRFGDASASGFTRSDGVAAVLLKPLAKAQADRDPIYALIVGSAVNNDGRSSGLLATPSREGQQAVLREAYRNAGISPGRVQYVEVHGTGTGVGDPVEVQSLGAVLAEGRDDNRPCLVGSVKTNIGHTEGAAGVAGLIKTALCLKHKTIPPSLHFKEPNPNIPWQELPLRVAKELTSWPEGPEPAIAGVSGFGLSATNAHLVLQEAPKAAVSRAGGSRRGRRAHLLTLSAHTRGALEDMARSYVAFSRDTGAALADICYSANVRRTHHDHRLAVVARSHEEVEEHLQAFLDGAALASIACGHPSAGGERKVVFVFPGQGSQWLGMGRRLMQQEPVFRKALSRCEEAFRRHVDWSLTDELAADASRSRLEEIDVVQPCLFAIQVALAQLWQHWGVAPAAVVGQSMGEVAAAYIAGALSLDDAAQIICRRSRLLKRLSGQGGMAVVGLSLEESGRLLAGYEDRLSVAVSSGPASTVIAGDTEALREVIETLRAKAIFCQPVKVDVASHSPQMDALREDLLAALAGIEPRPAAIPLYSTVTGEAARELKLDPEYWAANLRQPVLFSKAIGNLLEDGHELFVEISAHPILSGSIQQVFQHAGRQAEVLPSLRHDEDERRVMLSSLGALYTAGYTINWDRLYSQNRRLVQLPAYPWQRERFWQGPQGRPEHKPAADVPSRMLANRGFEPAVDTGTHYWEFDLGGEALAFINDHRVQGAAVLPGAAYLEMALAAGRSLFAGAALALERVNFEKPLILSEGPRQVQLVVSCQTPIRATFEFFSRDSGPHTGPWGRNARGTMRVVQAESPSVSWPVEAIEGRCNHDISQARHYESLAERGLQYGPCFRGVAALSKGDGEAIADITLPPPLATQATAYQIHPALLDSCFQVLAAILPDAQAHTYLPVGMDSFRVDKRPGDTVKSYAALQGRPERGAEVLKGDVAVLDSQGQLILEAKGLTMRRTGQAASAADIVEGLLYGLEWRPHSRPQPARHSPQGNAAWIVFTDKGAVGRRLVELLERNGESCVKVSAGASFAEVGPHHYQIDPASDADYARLLREVFGMPGRHFRGVAHLWSLDTPEMCELSGDLMEDSHAAGWSSALLLANAVVEAGQVPPPRLWLITRAAQAVGGDERLSLAQSPLWGLGRVIRQEHAKLRCSLVDVDAASEQEAMSLFLELSGDGDDDEIALRGEARYVARLARRDMPDAAESISESLAEDQPFRLEITTPGILDRLSLRETPRQEPGPGEIEIRVHAAGVNFRDVMLAMGVLPSAPDVEEDFGWECAGEVVRVGTGVKEFAVGDEVFAIAHPSLRSYVTTPACLALQKPSHLSYEEAATLPLVWLTAHYSLNYLGRLQSGERVLIHAASGGVGLAAVRIAQHLGAEVFATAGSDEKRDFLKSLGVQQVFDSRSLDFVDQVMQATGGEGLDLVLNSLTGEGLAAGLSLLRTGGRFLELGRHDIYKGAKLGLAPFQRNLAFFAIDLACLIRQCPASLGSLLREAMVLFANSGGSPLPLQAFSIGEVAESFRLMAQARHIGKIALRVRGERVKVARRAQPGFTLRSDSTYLITGGLGGLGLAVARWMIEQGARHLALLGRTDGSRAAQEAVEAMRRDAEIVVIRADVGSRQELGRALDDIDRRMPPLRGVVHAAGLLDDGILLQLDRSRFDSVMAPKVAGAWNLHLLTLDAPLDFFVLFSSVAAVLGSAGQGNYAAANAFLDGLAHYRRARSLPALSIDWGPWAEVGLAAEAGRGERLAQNGIGSLSPAEGVKVFERLLTSYPGAQVAALPFDFGQWSQGHPVAAASPVFAEMAARQKPERPSTAATETRLTRGGLLASEPHERGTLLESYLAGVLGRVLGFSKSGLDRIGADQPINRLGVDSLMALEMKTRIEADLGVAIPIASFLKGASLAQLSKNVLDQLSISSPALKVRAVRAAAGRQWEELII